jgi:hypothetical protein
MNALVGSVSVLLLSIPQIAHAASVNKSSIRKNDVLSVKIGV